MNWWPPIPLARRVSRGKFLAHDHSQMNMHTCAKFGIDCSSGLEAFPYLGIDDPLTSPCPSGIKGVFFLAKFGPNRFMFGIFPTFVNVWRPKPLQIPPGARHVKRFSRCPFPDESAYVCQIWSRLVQWFATGPSVTAKVSSVFSRCWRWLAKKHAKKQHLYFEKYSSGPRNFFLHFDSVITINRCNLAPPTLPDVLVTGRWFFDETSTLCKTLMA